MNWYKAFLKLAFRNPLDILSQNIARNVFNQIINKPGYQQISIVTNRNEDPEKDINLNLCGIERIVFDVLYSEDDSISIGGDYNIEQIFNTPIITIQIPFIKFSKKDYEFLFQQLKYVIRHEIEHSYHRKKNPSLKPSYDIIKDHNLMEQVNYVKKYLLDISEKDAYIRDSMLRAKNLKIPIENIISDLIDKQFYNANKEIKNNIEEKTQKGKEILKIINDVKNEYLNRIFEIYPNRRYKI